MSDPTVLLSEAVGRDQVLVGERVGADYARDECLTVAPQPPMCVVLPRSTADVAAILRVANEQSLPVTARGSGTGMSGAAIPCAGGIVVSFERMDAIVEIDLDNHVAVVQPGVTLSQLEEATRAHHLVYPVFPGEYSSSIGGNIATNAGGMRAVKYGVTRHHVIGLEAVLGTGDVIRVGGKFAKSSTGYDLTQLIVGSEGTLALVTEATLRLYPRPQHHATLMAPFRSLREVTGAVPHIVASGIGPLILEYLDTLSLDAVSAYVGLDLGIAAEVREAAVAYLVVMLENTHTERLDEDVAALGGLLTDLGAIDVYVLPPQSAAQLIDAREKAFWVAKANKADDIIDVVVPRASLADFMERAGALGTRHGAWIAGCGHAGDGNVHLSVFQRDPEVRNALLRELFEEGLALGGAISGEHGIGTAKISHFLDLTDPVKLELMRSIKRAFDPNGTLNPGTLID